MGFFEKLGRGLAKTRQAIFGSIGELENADRITEDTYEELLEQLILADVGLEVAEQLVDQLRERVKKEKLHTMEMLDEMGEEKAMEKYGTGKAVEEEGENE